MVNINPQEKKNSTELPQVQPETTNIPEQSIEQVPSIPSTEKIQEIPKSVEVPEKQIEQVREQVAETEEMSQKSKPIPVSPLMKDEDLIQDLKDVMSLDKPKQIKVLVYLAFKKGIHHAAQIANKLKDPYLMDEFHDTLVSELYDMLVKKKKIKPK